MRRLLRLILALAVLAPSAAHALGAGYHFEMHQFEIDSLYTSTGKTKVQLPVHRVRILDSSGLFATLIASARYDREVEESAYRRKTTETYWGEYTPMPRGIRVILDYAFYDGGADTQYEGEPKTEVDAEYSEFRFAVGAQFPLEHLYIDFDIIDMISRDLTGPDRIDYFAWQINGEFGGYFGPLRVGLRGESDLVSVVDSLFDDQPAGYAWGISSYIDFEYGSIAAGWRSYRRIVDSNGGVADGRMLTIGAQFEYY